MKIKIDDIKCQSGWARIQKNSSLFEWAGAVEFEHPQIITKSTLKTGKAVYRGPLHGCAISLNEVFGDVFITKWKRTKDNLISGVEFVGNAAPFAPLTELTAVLFNMTKRKGENEMYFVIQGSDGGSVEIYKTVEDLKKMLSEYHGEPTFLNHANELYLRDWDTQDMFIIKGEVVIPKPVEVIQRYEVE